MCMDNAKEDIEPTEEGRPKWKTRLGCAWLLAYLCMSIFEMFAIYDWLIWKYELNPFLSIVSAVVTGFTPGLGSLLAYFGATDVWGWGSLNTIIVFFWYYVPIMLMSLLSAMAVTYVFFLFLLSRLKAVLNNK